jgi:1-deoxyxylulose-5-phosphate synthase
VKSSPLGTTDLQVSRIALGGMSFGDPQSSRGMNVWALGEDDAAPILRRAVELGVNFWDTANVYGFGTSEEILGRAVRRFTRREDVVLATKVFFPMHDGPTGSGLSRRAILEQADASLTRLGTDYIDLYQIHRFDPATPVEETMAALHELVTSGKVRYLGASSMWAWQFAKLQHAAHSAGSTGFVSMQSQYSLMQREEEREMLPLLVDQNVSALPWAPLAKGRLARPWNTRTSRSQQDAMGSYAFGPECRPVADAVEKVAGARGLPMSQVALAWTLSKPVVAAPIVGVTAVRQLEEAAAAVDVSLSDDEIQMLEEPYTPRLPTGF